MRSKIVDFKPTTVNIIRLRISSTVKSIFIMSTLSYKNRTKEELKKILSIRITIAEVPVLRPGFS
jgi:hypothetical protein